MTAVARVWEGEWTAPPPAGSIWEDRLAPLRERRGEWARFGPFSPMSVGKQVSKINRGVYGPGFQAKRVSIAHQDWVYARYVPLEVSR